MKADGAAAILRRGKASSAKLFKVANKRNQRNKMAISMALVAKRQSGRYENNEQMTYDKWRKLFNGNQKRNAVAGYGSREENDNKPTNKRNK